MFYILYFFPATLQPSTFKGVKKKNKKKKQKGLQLQHWLK
jgi:hypothetical protein